MIKKYYDKLSAYPRLRILIIFVAIILVVFVLMRMFSSHQVQRSVVPPSDINTAPVNPSRPHPVGAGEYNQLAEIQKRQVLANAESSGKSYFENNLLQGGSPVTAQLQKSSTPVVKKKALAAVEPVSPQNFYAQERAETPKVGPSQPEVAPSSPPINPQEIAQAIETEKSAMQGQLSQVAGSWSYPSFQTTGGGSGNASSGSLGGGSVATTSVAIKAGTILFAVLEVTLNSDQMGTPVMATIVSGKLKGAKLLGSFSRQNDKLVVQFNTMTMDSRPSSIGINAYAIDAETAQNALASNVDNHYLLRYGSLLGAAFLEGFGNAWSSVQTSTNDSNGLINVYTAPPPEATAETAIYQGLGQIGTNMGQQMSQVFQTPPTVTLDAGTGLGILFMSDLSL
jgi:intracellular multiplication protein IcmE